MSTVLIGSLTRSLYRPVNVGAITPYLYIANNTLTNKRIAIIAADGLAIGNSKPMVIENNNKTAMQNTEFDMLSVCLTPNNIIGCVGATPAVMLRNLTGLYTVEVNGFSIVESATPQSLISALSTNPFVSGLGLRIVALPKRVETETEVYVFMLEPSEQLLNARIRLKYASDSRNVLNLTPGQLGAYTTDEVALSLGSLAANPTVGINSSEITFCLESAEPQSYCHLFTNNDTLGVRVNGEIDAQLYLPVFPNLASYEEAKYTITINGKVAKLSYEQKMSGDETPTLNIYWELKTSDRTYRWDVEGSVAGSNVGWRRVESLRETDKFVFCYDGFYVDGRPGLYVTNPKYEIANVVKSITEPTGSLVQVEETLISSKLKSVSVLGYATYIPWSYTEPTIDTDLVHEDAILAGVIATENLRAEETQSQTVSGGKNYQFTFPYTVDPLEDAYLLQLDADAINNSTLAEDTVILTGRRSATPRTGVQVMARMMMMSTSTVDSDLGEWTLGDIRRDARMVQGYMVLPITIDSASTNLVDVYTVDYDGKLAHNYVEGIYTVNVTVNMRDTIRPFDLICTGAQDDVSFEVDPSKHYYISIDGVSPPVATRGIDLPQVLMEQSSDLLAYFAEDAPPPSTVEIQCVPSDSNYFYSNAIHTATNQGVLLKYQIDDQVPKVFKLGTGIPERIANSNNFLAEFIKGVNDGSLTTGTNIKIRTETTDLLTTDVSDNGITSYNYRVTNNVGDHFLLPFGTVHANLTGVSATQGNEVPHVIRLFKYTDATHEGVNVTAVGGNGVVDIYPILFPGLSQIEIHSCGVESAAPQISCAGAYNVLGPIDIDGDFIVPAGIGSVTTTTDEYGVIGALRRLGLEVLEVLPDSETE